MEQTFLLLAALLCLSTLAAAKPAYKHLAGGPSEFLPPADPSSAAVASHIRILEPVTLQASDDGPRASEQTFLVDSDDFTFAVLCSTESHLESVAVVIADPSGAVRKPTEVSLGPFGLGGRTYPSKAMYFSGVTPGEWTVHLVMPAAVPARDGPIAVFSFVTFSDGDSPIAVTVSASSLNTLLGSSVKLQAVVVDPAVRRTSTGNHTGPSGHEQVDVVELIVRHPNGKTTTEPMHGDSLTASGDPAFAADVALTEIGSYQALVVVKGSRSDGKPYERSAWYWMTAVEKSAALSGKAIVTPSAADYHRDLKAEQLTVNLVLDSQQLGSIPASPPYRVYAEIFTGDAKASKSEPVAWIGGLSDVSELQSSSVLSLHLDTSWLQGHTGPFHLRNVRVEELDTYSIVSSVPAMDLPLEQDTVLRLGAMEQVKFITRQMRQGYHVGRKQQQHRNSTQAAKEGTLLLVHGYCAPETPYSVQDFSGYRVFEDLSQNRRISDFASLVAAFGEQHDSFGVVAHSQGGMAALDMYVYLATGLDNAAGERRLQTLATPWRGSPLTGLLAIIGDLLGFGCGDNSDMGYDGATKWLAGIPADARSEVYYYTGQYATGNLINYCILAANAVLSWPNDGMIEQKRSNLDGGNDMGHSKNQCHSVNMRNPPIAQNHERNAILNQLAAR